MEGFIYLHRKLLNWEWFDDNITFKVFVTCLLLANYKDKKWRGHIVPRGSFVTSLDNFCKILKISKMQLRSCLKKLEKSECITRNTTHNFTMINLCNYDDYQNLETAKEHTKQHKNNTGLTQKEHKINTRVTPTNNDNNTNNDNKKTVFYKTCFDEYLKINVIQHKELTKVMKDAIDKARKKFSEEEILTAIKRYGIMFNDKSDTFTTYKWTLKELLMRDKGINDFTDDGGKWIRYSDVKNPKKRIPKANEGKPEGIYSLISSMKLSEVEKVINE